MSSTARTAMAGRSAITQLPCSGRARQRCTTLLFRQLTDNLTLLLHTAPEPTGEQSEQLSARGITVVRGGAAGLVVAGDRLTSLRMASGQIIDVSVVVVGPRFCARDGVLASLGLAAVEHPTGMGTHVQADSTGRTAVPGVWVAGNVADPAAGIVAATAAGSWTAARSMPT